MADLSDVLDALTGVLSAALYPNGTAAPSAAGVTVSVVPGWPPPNKLDAAKKEGRAFVSIFPPPNLERDRTRAHSQWINAVPPLHTVTAVASGNTVTIGGTVAAGQNVGLIVDDATAAYPVQASDTPASIATALAALIAAGGRMASSTGPTLTVPGTHRLIARVGGHGRLVKEVERTDRCIMVSVWAHTPQVRTAVARIVRARLSDPKFISLVDGSAGWIRYDRTNDSDISERADLYRRDLNYWVEFGQYLVEDAFEVILPETTTQPVRVDGLVAQPPVNTAA